MRTIAVRRSLLLLSAVAALLATSVAPAAAAVPPEDSDGVVGEAYFDDGQLTPRVNCRYHGLPGTLDKFVAKPPRVWWSDNNSSDPDEHGTVGWVIRIQQTSDPETGPWATTFKTSVVKKTAFEGQGNDDRKADFTTRGIPWDRAGTKHYRVLYTVFWYKPNGDVRGKIRHWIAWYKNTGSLSGVEEESCANKPA